VRELESILTEKGYVEPAARRMVSRSSCWLRILQQQAELEVDPGWPTNCGRARNSSLCVKAS